MCAKCFVLYCLLFTYNSNNNSKCKTLFLYYLFKHNFQYSKSNGDINFLYFIHYALAKLWYVLIYFKQLKKNGLNVDGLKGLSKSRLLLVL